MAYITEGDPKLTLDEDGSEITFKGGQPVMDKGLENAAMINLLTAPGWWGNVLALNDLERIGSNFEEISKGAITIDKLNRMADAARKSQKALIDFNLASAVDVLSKNPTGRLEEVEITIVPPGRTENTLLVTRNGPNWIEQKNDPAYRRV